MTAATASDARARPADDAQREPAPAPHRNGHRRRGLTAGIFGVGAALPERVVTNDDIVARLETSDEWIVRRTGIRERRILAPDQPLSELAARACAQALEDDLGALAQLERACRLAQLGRDRSVEAAA